MGLVKPARSKVVDIKVATQIRQSRDREATLGRQLEELRAKNSQLEAERIERERIERDSLYRDAHPADACTAREAAIAELIGVIRFRATDKQIAKMLEIARGAKQPGKMFPVYAARLVHVIEYWRTRDPQPEIELAAQLVVDGFFTDGTKKTEYAAPLPLFDGMDRRDACLFVSERLARCFRPKGSTAKGVVTDLVFAAHKRGVDFGTGWLMAIDRKTVLDAVSAASKRHT